MSKRIIAVITAVIMTAAIFTACGDKTTETSAAETAAPVVETTVAETSEETVAETSAQEEGGIPQPGDTYNGHTVDHTEDQPNCDDGSHGTIWIFYTDSDAIDYIEY